MPPALCDSRRSSGYRRHTPSKQHLLCDGRSAAEVVLRHKDFRKARRRVKKKVNIQNDKGDYANQAICGKHATYDAFSSLTDLWKCVLCRSISLW